MTNKSFPRVFAFALAGAGAALVLAGCVDKANPDNVDKRSVERWNYLIEHKAEQAYDYLTPGFRTTQTREDYAAAMNNRPVKWTAAKFKGKQCDADRCKAQVEVTYSLTMPGMSKSTEGTRTMDEIWILVNGEWFCLPSD